MSKNGNKSKKRVLKTRTQSTDWKELLAAKRKIRIVVGILMILIIVLGLTLAILSNYHYI